MRRAYYRAYLWQTLDAQTWLPKQARRLIHHRWEKAYLAFARERGDTFYD